VGHFRNVSIHTFYWSYENYLRQITGYETMGYASWSGNSNEAQKVSQAEKSMTIVFNSKIPSNSIIVLNCTMIGFNFI
jgi:hypothetical protein